ncbi:hypothetical protein [Enterococcus mundtii]|uniref:hypothetical protein n=1 Tax=Enterococcus mundtii TaxID=53346 RepID=UPI0035C6F7C8
MILEKKKFQQKRFLHRNHKTYLYRFVCGEGWEISPNNFLKIIDILGIELTEFEEVIPLIKQGSKILENQLAEALAT